MSDCGSLAGMVELCQYLRSATGTQDRGAYAGAYAGR